MRMWGVEPGLLCRGHLLGEHLEMHMFAGAAAAGRSLKGYLLGGLVEVHNIGRRHRELAREMLARGYRHRSPLRLPRLRELGKVDIGGNLAELRRRCPECGKIQRRARRWGKSLVGARDARRTL
jgi:hypothetical protein